MSAFFFGLLFLNPSLINAASSSCSLAANQKADETVSVSYVHDGDTLKLSDGRKLRIIGINTPELGTKNNGNVTEPFALQARDYLRKLIKQSKYIEIQYGVQRKDHYGRLLAHVFISNGLNVSALMLQNGLARSLHVPPNDWQYSCYDRLDKQAQQLKTGLWSNNYYKTVDVTTLIPRKNYKSQFTQVSGVVTRIGNSKKNIWINLSENFALRINKSSLAAFKNWNFTQLPGKTIIARGYVVYYPNKKQFRMLVRHPVALAVSN